MNHLTRLKPMTSRVLISLAVICLALLPQGQAVNPPPDGGYPGFNTAEGTNALKNLTTGIGNAAVGWYSLFNNTDGSYNTGVGAGTLLFNVGDQAAGEGTENTAVGTGALLFNTTGAFNTANGAFALFNNTTGDFNTAVGHQALANNTTGNFNTANGFKALFANTTGFGNTANGYRALLNNTEGGGNTVLGVNAGENITGNDNICIGFNVSGEADVSNTTWIRNVYASVATTRQVYVNSDNKIGTLSSSRRYKEDVKPMDKASETLLALKPVTFRYKKEIDRSRALSFGLIAEEVADISPDLITRDEKGQPQTVRYDAVNAMLLNEFLKEHSAVLELKKEIAALTATVKEQAAQIQKVAAHIEMNKSAPRVVQIP